MSLSPVFPAIAFSWKGTESERRPRGRRRSALMLLAQLPGRLWKNWQTGSLRFSAPATIESEQVVALPVALAPPIPHLPSPTHLVCVAPGVVGEHTQAAPVGVGGGVLRCYQSSTFLCWWICVFGLECAQVVLFLCGDREEGLCFSIPCFLCVSLFSLMLWDFGQRHHWFCWF